MKAAKDMVVPQLNTPDPIFRCQIFPVSLPLWYNAGLSDQHVTVLLYCRLVHREGQALKRSEVLEILSELMPPR